MKIYSWNVNGIRSALRKGFAEFLRDYDPDILCLQEVKATPDQVEFDFSEFHDHLFWNPAEKKGYSGTAVFSKAAPAQTSLGLGIPEHDQEGRVVTCEFADFWLVNVYTPNSKRGLLRLDYRVESWDAAFREHLVALQCTKPVIFTGDLNVAHREIDLANPKSNRNKTAGFTDRECESFSKLLESGFVDTFRHFTPEGGHYTWWSARPGVRERNIGWRIDYFGVSESFLPRVKSSNIHPSVLGSDHCPISIEVT